MKINKKFKIDKATTKEEYRPAMKCINIERIDDSTGIAIATDGHILSVCEVNLEEKDTIGLISTKGFLASLKSGIGLKKHKYLDAYANIKLLKRHQKNIDNVIFPRPDETLKFPNWHNLIPEPPKNKSRISLDVGLLKKLSDCMGTNRVTLEFETGNETGIVVVRSATSSFTEESFGVIMPVCTSDSGATPKIDNYIKTMQEKEKTKKPVQKTINLR